MKICITGITGTVGSAFTRLLKNDHELVGVDHREEGIAKFKQEFPNVEVKLEDFSKFDFANQNFDMVIHLAAYKHVDLAESNVFSAVENNVTKTVQLFENAKKNNVKIVFFSTDKAVDPVSVYGMTKRLGEKLCWEAGGQVVRSGNIIGSNGSVFHIWRKCIEEAKPLKITDMNMVRYFIKDDVAVDTAWTGVMAGKKLTIIDNGGERTLKEILISVLAEYNIDLDAYVPGIEIIGARPGERLWEKIRYDDEKELE